MDALVESLASENLARMRLMQSADEAVGKKLKMLQRRYRRVRQDHITDELFDVIIGSDAVSSMQN